MTFILISTTILVLLTIGTGFLWSIRTCKEIEKDLRRF